ncbi:hypothetical protein AcW1_009125 [Taiwanofungus camphoratus]|nr:hypothetical protein AcV5_007148 [Antrodia cinnamomea]KAI0949539.1 hypothetical protein AcW1_009125 [Antrodia cinnamomea]KAI0958638.1 hypothetical protein AcV7_004397 [Antrodia cinnamomea]
MQRVDVNEGLAIGLPATVIDLREHGSPDTHHTLATTASSSRHSQAYYAVDTSPDRAKKRKIERACDFCRKRKTKCDGPRMQDNICTNCVQNGRTCTYIEGSRPRGPPKAYVTTLEDRIEKAEALLKRLRPEADFTPELGPSIVRDCWKTDSPTLQYPTQPPVQSTSSSRNETLSLATTIPAQSTSSGYQGSVSHGRAVSTSPVAGFKSHRHKPNSLRHIGSSVESLATDNRDASSGPSLSGSDNEDSAVELSLVQGMTQLTVHGLRPTHVTSKEVVDSQWRFHGKSSSFKLINTTREFKQQHMDEVSGTSVQEQTDKDAAQEHRPNFAPRRSEYWRSLPWEISWEGTDHSVTPSFLLSKFPSLDLAESLIQLYFDRNNRLFPLLHRPTFEHQWREGLYKNDVWFACVCMSMFGVASRWSNDPRVLPSGYAECSGESDDGIWALAGVKYIDVALDVHRRHRSILIPANLFEIQTLVLMAMYLRGTIAHAESWTLVGIGVRKAQDVGAHRRKVYGHKPTAEEELWKRAIWHLITIDRLGSMLIDRPCSSRDEDFDLEFPLEVDDEYWQDSSGEWTFQQPREKPSLVTAFVYWAKLAQVSGFALKIVRSIGKAKLNPLGQVGPRWSEEKFAQLNELMLEWVASIPEYLKWSSGIQDDVLAAQSATLYLSYYLLQITVYRPFISIPRILASNAARGEQCRNVANQPDFPLSALSICVNAAKAGTYILEALSPRRASRQTIIVQLAFVYAGVLLVNLWIQIARGCLQKEAYPNSSEDHKVQTMETLTEDIVKLMKLLDNMSPRWDFAREATEQIRASLPACMTPNVETILEQPAPNGRNFTEAPNTSFPTQDVPLTNSAPSRVYPLADPPASYEGNTLYQVPPATSLPSNSLPLTVAMTLGPNAASHSQVPQIWSSQDIPVSARRISFSIPEPYEDHDECLRTVPQVRFFHPRSNSHVRSTFDHAIPTQRDAYLRDSNFGALEVGGTGMQDPPQTANLNVGVMDVDGHFPYVKREQEDARSIHPFFNGYQQSPSYESDSFVSVSAHSSRNAGYPSPGEQPNLWDKNGNRLEQWRDYPYLPPA